MSLQPFIRRVDYHYRDDAYNPANSGSGGGGLVSPKINFAYEIDPKEELYLNFGDSFHSNDVRGVTYVDDPETNAPFNSSGTPV